jgi:hypothetical protein
MKIDIFRNTKEEYDIIVLDTERYLSSVAFDYVVEYIRSHVSDSLFCNWFYNPSGEGSEEDETVKPCLKYQGIAIRLLRFLDDRSKAKQELAVILQDALAALD